MLLIPLLTFVFGYVLYALTKLRLRYYRRYGMLEKIPGPPMESRILGHTSLMSLTPETRLDFVSRLSKEYGGISRLWMFWLPEVLISDADYAEVYFHAKSLEEKSHFYAQLHDWLGNGLLTSGGELWHERRKLITPAFHFNVLNALCDTLVQNAVVLIRKLREHPKDTPVNVTTLMHLVALDNICESAMGIKIDALNNPKLEYIQAVEDAGVITILRGLRPWYWGRLFYYLPLGQKYRRSLDIIFELAQTAIQNSRNKRSLQQKATDVVNESKEKKRLAFLDILLEACDSTTNPLSDEGLREEVNTFMFGGHETTAVSMGFTLFLLGNHPDIQEKCYEELDDIFQGSDRKATVDDLRSMKYLEQVIKESLRLFPSAPMISRKAKADTKFGDYVVPEGTLVTFSIYALHRNPKYFSNPEKFDPDRFSPENIKGRHHYAYTPFAAGSRNCIGQKFAMMEEKVVLSSILRNFVLESIQREDELKLQFDLVQRPLKPIEIKFKPRNTV
nr:PREDICTED: cytochrome P450 4C1-like isoform X1 [Bemisia tabaci]